MLNKLFILSGPSGVGKTSLANYLIKTLPQLQRLVTYTTRPPRPNETTGTDYHFVSKETFIQKISAGEFFEYDEHYGNFYGNSKKDLQKIVDSGKVVLLLLDPQVSLKIKKAFPDVQTVFIAPDNLENLANRIRQRRTNEDDFQKRWQFVTEELALQKDFDLVVINAENKLLEAGEEIAEFIKNRAGLD